MHNSHLKWRIEGVDRPLNLSVPTLHAGNVALISWSAVEGATSYQLDRRLDIDADFVPIYGGVNNFFEDALPIAATTAAYRVQASATVYKTWDDLDYLDRSWDELDALDWTWAGDVSEFTVSENREVIPNRAPIISGQDGDLGYKFRGFDIVFSVTDPDPSSTVNIEVNLDDDIIFNMPNAQQGANYTVSITDAQIFAMEDQSSHIVIITATDNKGETANRILTFTAVEDLTVTALFYVIRDGRPVASLMNARQWTDYMEIGTHRYIVRGVDRYGNFSDSNEVIVTITLKHAVLALVSNPSNFINLIWRLDGKPTMGYNYSNNFNETWYEGREFPIYENSGQKSNSVSLAFSTLTLSDQRALFNMISPGESLIYRDQYEIRVVGVIVNFGNEFQGRYKNATHNALINFNLTLNQSDFNEVIEYD